MSLRTPLIATGAALALTAFTLSATAGGHGGNPAVDARQGAMNVMALNIGVLGGMARGNTDYDAETAQAAANNLLTMTQIDQRFFWAPGTDSDSVEGSRALAAIWEEGSGIGTVGMEYATAVAGLAAVAGDGLDAMRGALGPVGAACGACHDDYRLSQ